VKRKAYEKSKNSPEGYPKGQILAFKLKKIPGDCDTVQNGGDKVYHTDGADKEGASNATEKSSVGHKDKLLNNKKDMSEEKSDDAEELQGVDAGDTTQSVGKDDKSLSDNNQDIMLREDIKKNSQKLVQCSAGVQKMLATMGLMIMVIWNLVGTKGGSIRICPV
jgi:lupus La protein